MALGLLRKLRHRGQEKSGQMLIFESAAYSPVRTVISWVAPAFDLALVGLQARCGLRMQYT